MKPPRIPGKRVVWIGGRPVVMSDAEVKDMLGAATGKRKGKLKRAADRKWEEEANKRAK